LISIAGDSSRARTEFTDDDVVCTVRGLRTTFMTRVGPLTAVDRVDLDLKRGRTLGVVGESGSGKSVLSRSVMGLMPLRNVRRRGIIVYRGTDISDWSRQEMRRLWGREMAMVLQDPMTSLTPVMQIGDQIMEGMRHHLRVSKADARDRAVAALRSVGMPAPEKRLNEYPHQLSGGMRQRVTIAMAMACDPALLFADEPTTALDVTVQAEILELLDEQREQRGMSMVLVTHDLGVVASHAHDVAVMYAGQIIEQAPTLELFSNMAHPYTEALLQSIPQLDNEPHTRLFSIAGRPPDLISPPVGCRFSPRCRYAQPRCSEEPPGQFQGSTPEHWYRCFYPVGSPEGAEALARNVAAGVSAAGTPVTLQKKQEAVA
jgi:peptide/nickel transport system ATP-binding protein